MWVSKTLTAFFCFFFSGSKTWGAGIFFEGDIFLKHYKKVNKKAKNCVSDNPPSNHPSNSPTPLPFKWPACFSVQLAGLWARDGTVLVGYRRLLLAPPPAVKARPPHSMHCATRSQEYLISLPTACDCHSGRHLRHTTIFYSEVAYAPPSP